MHRVLNFSFAGGFFEKTDVIFIDLNDETHLDFRNSRSNPDSSDTVVYSLFYICFFKSVFPTNFTVPSSKLTDEMT